VADLSWLFWLFLLALVTTIHRQETMNLLGFPIVRYIDRGLGEGAPCHPPDCRASRI